MKFLNFDFGHPIIGHADLLQLAIAIPRHHLMSINTKKSNIVCIPIDGCRKGKWQLTLDWEHNGQGYFHEEEFEVKE